MTKSSKQFSYVIITGASGGIGQALVKTFHASGYGVIATDINSPKDNLPCEYFIQADLQKTVIDEDYANEIFTQIRDRLQDISLIALINNAAVQIVEPCDKLSRADWKATLNVNLLAPFFWTQAFLPELKISNGSVINISSIHAKLTKAGFSAYATSKAALSGLTRSMALELGKRVRINAIEPAAIDSDMLRAGFVNDKGGLLKLETYHPTQSIGSPEELAKLAVMMVSHEYQFLNGAIIPFDGGIGVCLHDPVE